MAIRLRRIERRWVALCASKTKPEKGDLYLDDNIHHALIVKFGLDFFSKSVIQESLADDILIDIMQRIESDV